MSERRCEKCQWFERCAPTDTGAVWVALCKAPRPSSCFCDDSIITRGDGFIWNNYAERCVFYAERSE
jgi:hypothetical protein